MGLQRWINLRCKKGQTPDGNEAGKKIVYTGGVKGSGFQVPRDQLSETDDEYHTDMINDLTPT